ncbi:MerR family transcriptional regulator [Alkaliphilus sp. MSJ-5]|uniref:MerR family transcriptional regulator n=1 Tax=Alkaliphilus flagellatus TaxID=2841507 RepID=A0ABS6G5D9_9FIRM|nr:MerR family transcriptional regulator [Alkaliphilus flagellatus]MBU5676620.1 MerR family transcriptional regulator [Alkaliphilus flagellatus]
MKIGAFAKKHNVSLDTIRHYLDIQLLLAEKIGAQYHFTEEDSKDMEEIIELKRLKFSLIEIQNILSYKRFNSNRTIEFRNHFKNFLEKKREEIKIQQQDIEKTMDYIECKIYELEMEEKSKIILGIPLTMISFLRCPHCKSSLNLSEGIIENNMIISGKITCYCDYSLIVENGIIVDQNSIRDKCIPTKAAYYEKTSSKFINFIFKSMATLIRLVESEIADKKYILELGKCSGFFLMQYLPYIPKDSIYILIDYDLKRMNQLKNNLELNHNHNNFVFLCCNYDELPLVDNFINLVIENFTTELHAEKNGMLLGKTILPLIKSGGYLASIYAYFNSTNTNIEGIPNKIRSFYDKGKLLNMLRSSSIKEVEFKETGPADGGGVYDSYVKGNEYCHLIYLGTK